MHSTCIFFIFLRLLCLSALECTLERLLPRNKFIQCVQIKLTPRFAWISLCLRNNKIHIRLCLLSVCVFYILGYATFFFVCIIYVVVTRNNSRFVCFVAIDDAALNQLVARICRQKEETTSCVIHCFTLRSKKLKHTLSSKTKTTHNTLKTQMFYVFIMCVSVCHCVCECE